LLRRLLAGVGELAASGARSSAALDGDVHQWADGERGHQPERLARRDADRTVAAAIGPPAPLGQHPAHRRRARSGESRQYEGGAARRIREGGFEWTFRSATNSK